MIVTGKALNAKQAYKLALVDALFHQEFIDKRVLEFVEKLNLEKEKKHTKTKKNYSLLTKIVEHTFVGKLLIHNMAKKQILAKTKDFILLLKALEVT